ncbi:hypothetical protein EAF00_004851 [Botryotinia globosa]|nr:hypothetical protein EAF00_004851 [Botryotinia globosa]
MTFCHQTLKFPTTPFDKRLLAPKKVLKTSTSNIDIGKVTDRAKTDNDHGGLPSDGQKPRVMSYCNSTTKLPIPMLMESQNPHPGSRHLFPTPILILDRRYLSALDRSTAELIFSRLLCERKR